MHLLQLLLLLELLMLLELSIPEVLDLTLALDFNQQLQVHLRQVRRLILVKVVLTLVNNNHHNKHNFKHHLRFKTLLALRHLDNSNNRIKILTPSEISKDHLATPTSAAQNSTAILSRRKHLHSKTLVL